MSIAQPIQPAPSSPAESALLSPRFTGAPFLQTWRAEDFGAHPENAAVVQHPRTGLVYFGNGSGVLEFDGAHWRLIRVPGDRAVSALGVDRSGRIWGATNATIFRLEAGALGQLEARSMLGRLPPEFRLQGLLARCVVTPRGVCFLDRQSLIVFPPDEGPARVWPVAEKLVVALRLWEIGGEVHVMIGGNLVFRLVDDRLERVPGLTYTVCAARAEPAGGWRLLTVAGTEHWENGRRTLRGELPVTRGTQRATFLADGRGVFATPAHGIVVCDAGGRVLQTLGRAHGLPGNHVLDVCADQEGGVWAVYNNGIARVQLDSPYAVHGPAAGVDGAISALALHGRRLFVAGTEGVMQRLDNGRFQAVPGVHAAVRTLTVSQEWLFLQSTALLGLRPGLEAAPAMLENRNYYGLLPLDGHAGWFVHGANEGVRWARFEGEAWKTHGPLAALRGAASVLLESPAGVVWAAHGGGVQRVDFRGGLRPDAPSRRFGPAEGLPAQPAAMFLLGGRIGALAAGRLLQFDPDAERFAPDSRIENLDSLGAPGRAPPRIDRVHPDAGDTIWLQLDPPSRAVARLRPAGGDRWRAEPVAGEPLRHLRPRALFHEAATRTLWHAGYRNLVSQDLGWKPTVTARPPAAKVRLVETLSGEVLFGGVRTEPAAADESGLQLEPDQDALRIRFAAASFQPDHNGVVHTEYRTRVDGLEREWTPWSRQTERELNNLPWRALAFRVQARDDAGRIGPEAAIGLTLAPAWWATRWAWAGYGALGLVGLAGLVRLRTLALHRRNVRLESIVGQRTRELAETNRRLAAQNTELARLHRLELDEKAAAQLAEEKARLELLRYQLNPHFLLSAFTTLRSLVFSAPDAAAQTIERLADFCRLALTRSDESGATVDDELRLIESYLDTEKARWRDELEVELRVDPAARSERLPPFLLQPVVENAIKYGGRTSPGTLHVRVRIDRTADGLAVEIANSGEWVGRDSPHRQDATGIGMENLRERLRRKYRDAHELATEARDGWVFVRLQLKNHR